MAPVQVPRTLRPRWRTRGRFVCLTFDLREAPGEIHLTISAPEEARLGAAALFEQFVPANEPRRSSGSRLGDTRPLTLVAAARPGQ